MSFLNKNEKLHEKYNKIWSKISNNMKRGFYSEPLYNVTMIKSDEGKTNVHFIGDKVPK